MHQKHLKLPGGEQFRIIIIAALIGLLAGGANIVFRAAVDLVHETIFLQGYAWLEIDRGGWRRFLLPLLPMSGALLLILLSLRFPGEVNGYGFPRFLRQVNLEGGLIRVRSIFLKIVSCALTVGTGGSAGVEGPIAQVGGGVGSTTGRFFRVSGQRRQVYIAAGCAGAVAAFSNAPIAGVFFAAEIVLLGTYGINAFAALVVSSAVATVVSRAFYGTLPFFSVPAYQLVNPLAELPLYALMGIIMGVGAVFFIRVFYRTRDYFTALPLSPQLKPVLGALLLGIIAIFFPQVMGDGFGYLEEVLAGGQTLGLMALLVLAKIFATAITLGSGGAGGIFAPALFIGGMLGGSFGNIVNHWLPALTANPGAYAAVGVGAFLAATTQAPLTAIFLLFEMTGNYQVIIPIMLASMIGTLTAAWLHPDSINTVDFSREGIDLREGRESALLQEIKVGSVMNEDVDFISENANGDDLLKIFALARSFYFPVVDDRGRMSGIVSLQDAKDVIHDRELRLSAKVGDICARKVVTLTPDDNLHTAMALFDRYGIEEIPVVEALDNRWVLGLLKRSEAMAAYNRETIKRGLREAG